MAIMTGTRYDPDKKFKKAAGDILTPATVTPTATGTNLMTYVPYILGAIVIIVVVCKLKKKK